MTPRSPTGFADKLGDVAPAWRAIGGSLVEPLRYGENPHQTAAFYSHPRYASRGRVGAPAAGKQLSYNNINDTDGPYECIAEFDAMRTAACVIVKHAIPAAWRKAPSCSEAYARLSRAIPPRRSAASWR